MEYKHHRFAAFAIALMVCLSFLTAAHAESRVHEKSVWDVSTALLMGDFIDALKTVRDTHDLMVSKGATPDIVVLFRSMSVSQVTRTERFEQMIAPILIEESRTLLEQLAALPGVRLETDARSRPLLREEHQRIVTLIDDVYLALIAYQAEGYSLVTISPLAGRR